MLHLKKEKKHGYYHNLWLSITIAVIPFIAVTLMIINSVIVGNGYKQFTIDLYQSVKNGIETDSLRAEYNGVSTRLSEDNAFNVANTIDISRFVNYRKKYEITDEMFFDFSDGNRMWLYTYDDERMLIRFIYEDGEEKTYITKEITKMVTFERLVSADRGNSVWN